MLSIDGAVLPPHKNPRLAKTNIAIFSALREQIEREHFSKHAPSSAPPVTPSDVAHSHYATTNSSNSAPASTSVSSSSQTTRPTNSEFLQRDASATQGTESAAQAEASPAPGHGRLDGDRETQRRRLNPIEYPSDRGARFLPNRVAENPLSELTSSLGSVDLEHTRPLSRAFRFPNLFRGEGGFCFVLGSCRVIILLPVPAEVESS